MDTAKAPRTKRAALRAPPAARAASASVNCRWAQRHPCSAASCSPCNRRSACRRRRRRPRPGRAWPAPGARALRHAAFRPDLFALYMLIVLNTLTDLRGGGLNVKDAALRRADRLPVVYVEQLPGHASRQQRPSSGTGACRRPETGSTPAGADGRELPGARAGRGLAVGGGTARSRTPRHRHAPSWGGRRGAGHRGWPPRRPRWSVPAPPARGAPWSARP